jgi:diguanylate cyclase (GGDEF)-like protein
MLAGGLVGIAAGDLVYALYELIAPVLLVSQTLLARGRVDGLASGAASMLLFLLVVRRIVGLVRQVEDQAAQLAALASHDGLTGMPNRRTWEGELPVAMDRARRDGVPLSVALLDLDHFKRFNDQHGHQAGDRLLKSATAAWSAMLRTSDLLCRYGGEEFSVLLPGATTEQAAEVLERLRAVTPQQQTSRPAWPAGRPGDLRGAGRPRGPRALPGQGRRPGPDCRRRPEHSGVALTGHRIRSAFCSCVVG